MEDTNSQELNSAAGLVLLTTSELATYAFPVLCQVHGPSQRERTGSRLWGDLVHHSHDMEPQWRIDKVLDMTNGPFPALKWMRSKLVLQTKANPT